MVIQRRISFGWLRSVWSFALTFGKVSSFQEIARLDPRASHDKKTQGQKLPLTPPVTDGQGFARGDFYKLGC